MSIKAFNSKFFHFQSVHNWSKKGDSFFFFCISLRSFQKTLSCCLPKKSPLQLHQDAIFQPFLVKSVYPQSSGNQSFSAPHSKMRWRPHGAPQTQHNICAWIFNFAYEQWRCTGRKRNIHWFLNKYNPRFLRNFRFTELLWSITPKANALLCLGGLLCP